MGIPPLLLKPLLPLATAWAEAQERRILAEGTPLSPAEMEDARAVGVQHPEKVRYLVVRRVPIPENALLQKAGEFTGLISGVTSGMALRYGIYLRGDCFPDRHLLAHELTHTGQYERLGGIGEFLEKYLMECLTIGYPAAPMEQEAILAAARIR